VVAVFSSTSELKRVQCKKKERSGFYRKTISDSVNAFKQNSKGGGGGGEAFLQARNVVVADSNKQ
jgi:hypothetical protein